MPTTYEELLMEAQPQVIETRAQYDRIHQRAGDLIRRGRARSAEETKLMRLLGLLIEDYDRKHGLPSGDSTPAERLEFLMEQSGRKPAELLPIFGQRSHVSEALSGKRSISASQARKLGDMFRVNPGLFV